MSFRFTANPMSRTCFPTAFQVGNASTALSQTESVGIPSLTTGEVSSTLLPTLGFS